MQKKEITIQKLKEVRDKIPEIKAKEVTFRDTANFNAWRATGIKWLRLGLPNTSLDLSKFEHELFFDTRVREGPDDYDFRDQQEYEKDCDLAMVLLDSAIENLQMDLVPEPPEPQQPPRRGRGPKYGDVTITEPGTVVIGDRNVVSIVDSITISDFLNVLKKEIEAKIADAEQRKGLLQKLKELSQNPAANIVMNQALGTLLRGAFGG